MSLINCPECTQQVSDQAAKCPHCGVKLGASNWARAGYGVVALIGLFIVLVIIGDRMDTPERRAADFAKDKAACMEAVSASMRSDVSRFTDCVAWAERAEKACRNISISGKPVTVATLCGPNLR